MQKNPGDLNYGKVSQSNQVYSNGLHNFKLSRTKQYMKAKVKSWAGTTSKMKKKAF